MTIKWVQQDPLVMNGEPFCYGSRLTVRQLLELRAQRLRPDPDPEGPPRAARLGIAAAYTYAADHRERYAEFFEADGSLAGPGYARPRRPGCPPSTACRASSSAREPARLTGRRRLSRSGPDGTLGEAPERR